MPANSGDALLYFPQAYAALGNGDLQSIVDFTYSLVNNGKVVKTLRAGVAGVVRGKHEANMSFNTVVDEDGMEHNWARLVQNGTIKQVRVKVPGGDTFVFNGMFTQMSGNQPNEDAHAVSLNFVGKMGKV